MAKGRSSETFLNNRKSLSGTTIGGGLKRFKVIDKKITNMTTDIKKTTLTDIDEKALKLWKQSTRTNYPLNNFQIQEHPSLHPQQYHGEEQQLMRTYQLTRLVQYLKE